MGLHLSSGIRFVMSSPSISSYPLALSNLTPNDKVLFYRYGLGPTRPVHTPIIHHAVETHARNQPDAVAVEHSLFNHSLTYGQLDVQANRLARRLRAVDIVPGKRVCILARRSTYLIVAILAVLKSGAQYVPLDAVTITDATLGYVLEDSKPSAILVMDEFGHRVKSQVPTLVLEDVILADEVSNADATKPEDTSCPSDGAYVIYTSGTTGVPKGVDVKHHGVTNGTPPHCSNTPLLTLCVYSNQRVPRECRHAPRHASRPTFKYRFRYGRLGDPWFLVQWVHSLYPRQYEERMDRAHEDY